LQLTRRITNNDMTFGQGLGNFAVDAEACVQNIVTRLRTYKGEWFLDTSFGIGWTTDILVKPSNLPLSESILKTCILQTDGVDELRSFSFVVTIRKATVTARVALLDGSLQDIQVDI
jgi:hypothetical protein